MIQIVFYDRVPWWIVDFVILALLLAAGEAGFRWGRRSQSKVDERTESKMAVVEGGLMGVLGLLLAFTMSMAVSRFESRKQIALDEANAIGTSYLRTKLLPPEESAEIARLLRRYVDLRLQTGGSGNTVDNRAALEPQFASLQARFWSLAVGYAHKDPNPTTAGLLLISLNQVIDLENTERMAFLNRVPPSVICLDLVVGFFATNLVGYGFGLGARRQGFSLIMFTLAITLALAVIIDLNRPSQGFIQMSQRPLIDLQKQLLQSDPGT